MSLDLPTYVFSQLGKRSGWATKQKYGNKYKAEMARRGRLGGRPRKKQSFMAQTSDNIVKVDK